MTDKTVEQIAAGLTKAQREALMHHRAGGCSFGWARIGTLEALRSRGLIGYKPGPGSFYSPQTGIQWPLTPRGLAVKHLLETSDER